MFIECMNTLAEDSLARCDKLGMAHSLEGRFPMLCNKFKNYIRSIPSLHKTSKKFYEDNWANHNKALFKNAYRGVFPNKHFDHISKRGKTGWRFPTDELIIGGNSEPAPNGPFRTWIYDILNNKELMEIFEYKKTDILNKYMCNFGWKEGLNKSGTIVKMQANIGQKSQKELFIILAFATWYKVFNMSM